MITQKLIALADTPYRDFTAALIPTVDKACIIGVRTPAMRSLAKELLKNESEKAMAFLEELPHYYYEENNLHAFIIAELKDFKQVMIIPNAFYLTSTIGLLAIHLRLKSFSNTPKKRSSMYRNG